MGNPSRKQAVGLMVLLVLVIGIVGLSAGRNVLSSASSSGIILREPPSQEASSPQPVSPPGNSLPDPKPVADGEPSREVVVHVAGAVRKPGVYHLRPGARGEDALKAAGGPKPEANTDAVNLAARLEDGCQLYFPTRKEQPEGGAPAEVASPAAYSAATKTQSKAAPGTGGVSKAGRKGGSGKPGKLTHPAQGTINLNTATAEQLQRLPGVGPAMAERLLEFRKENHGFQSVEDLLQVSGIGEKKFEKMRPFVRVR